MTGRYKTGEPPARAGAPESAAQASEARPKLAPDSSPLPPRSQPVPHFSGNAPSFLDGLFVALANVRFDTGLEEAAGELLTAFAHSFDDIAVGACLVRPTGELLTVRRSPRLSRPEMPDPTRVFSEFEHETVIDLGAGSTLHVASDDEAYLPTVSGPSERLATALRSVIERTSALEQLRAERRETEELRLQVIHSEKLASLGQIAAGIAHELNNPLTSILAYSDYLKRDWEKRGLNQADNERIRRIGEAAERILAFTRDLIAYSRPTASVPGPVDIHEVIDRALVFCEHVITPNKVVVERTFGSVRLVSGVAGQLTQVFVNLITNACQAMRTSGGRLVVTTELNQEETFVTVSVSDQGHGIREEHMHRLFEPYFTTKLEGGGTGLGLPIVQNIIKNHGGTIGAKNLEVGAVFMVELPVSARVTLLDT